MAAHWNRIADGGNRSAAGRSGVDACKNRVANCKTGNAAGGKTTAACRNGIDACGNRNAALQEGRSDGCRSGPAAGRSRIAAVGHRMRASSHPGALENRRADLFRLESLAGNGARGPAVLLVVGVDLAHGLGDFA